ncbi:HAD family phosphatase [Phytomonospora sp. NPDC050363]|uniref:HAD family hydrolase n=1 Tax=Phytomonospora sp. NPDC050363 TaxID=3155642 RepID=UPI0033E8DCED
MTPKLIIFDNDGVLVDSERLSNVVFAAMLTEAGLPTTFEQSVDLYMGKRTTDCVALIESNLGSALPAAFIADYEQRCGDVLRRELVAVEGVAELLETLQRDGTAYCIASSGTPAEIDLRLTVTGLAEHFETDWIHSGVMVAHGKPAPDLFLYAAERHGVAPSDCVVIEDSIAGVTGAKAAGMFVVGHAALLPPERLAEAGADIVVGSMREVKGLLPEL